MSLLKINSTTIQYQHMHRPRSKGIHKLAQWQWRCAGPRLGLCLNSSKSNYSLRRRLKLVNNSNQINKHIVPFGPLLFSSQDIFITSRQHCQHPEPAKQVAKGFQLLFIRGICLFIYQYLINLSFGLFPSGLDMCKGTRPACQCG